MKRILRERIDEREKEIVRKVIEASDDSVQSKIFKFNKLTGTEFENLLARLYRKMGYQVELIGKVGDQGGDLRITRDGEIILVQAKKYSGSVGNKAVQEAVAARSYYGCHRAAVVTTGVFTKEAVELAKSNDIELIDGEQLKKILLDNLKEIWE
jgi:restriction system protein